MAHFDARWFGNRCLYPATATRIPSLPARGLDPDDLPQAKRAADFVKSCHTTHSSTPFKASNWPMNDEYAIDWEDTMDHIVAMADDYLEGFSSGCMALELCASLSLFKKVNTRARVPAPADKSFTSRLLYDNVVTSSIVKGHYTTRSASASRPKDLLDPSITKGSTRWLGWGW